MGAWHIILLLLGTVTVAAGCSLFAVGFALWDHGRKDWTQDHDY